MKVFHLFGAALILPSLAFGWGAGHDTIARALASRLPEPWHSKLQGETLRQFCEDNHYPDARSAFGGNKRITPDEQAYLTSKKMSNSGQFHADEGRGVAFTLLVRALRENRPESALLWLGALSHSTADMAACNHDPIVHLATYGWGDKNWNIRLPNGKALGSLDLGWIETQPEAKAIWEKHVAQVVAADSGKSAEDAMLEVMQAGLQGVETCSAYGVPIVRAAAGWTVTQNSDDEKSLAESFSVLGCWAVEQLLCDFLAAERLAKAETVPEVTEVATKRYQAAFSKFVSARTYENDSLVKGLVTPLRPGLPCLGVLSEPTWRMNDGMLGFNDRVLAAQTATSLRKKGKNAVLVDVRKFMAGGIPVASFPAVIVFAQKVSPYYTLRPEALADQLVKYRKAGGKIIWIGGDLPDRALCDFPKEAACHAEVGKGYDYCWTRLPVETNAYATLTLKIGDHAVRKLERTPTFSAGWHIPSNTTRFTPKADEAIRPLAYMYDKEKPLLVGGAWPKAAPDVAYLPTYAVYPYLWTKETPTLVPFEPGLDSQGLEALQTVFAALQMEGL